jgi:hypothetical protein
MTLLKHLSQRNSGTGTSATFTRKRRRYFERDSLNQ